MTLNEILGEAACRKLTEFLGECYHSIVDSYHGIPCCTCGKLKPFPRLDFSDPRVWTRLVGKFATYSVSHVNDNWSTAIIWDSHGNDFDGEGKSDAEAVCRAVLAWLEEGEKP